MLSPLYLRKAYVQHLLSMPMLCQHKAIAQFVFGESARIAFTANVYVMLMESAPSIYLCGKHTIHIYYQFKYQISFMYIYSSIEAMLINGKHSMCIY